LEFSDFKSLVDVSGRISLQNLVEVTRLVISFRSCVVSTFFRRIKIIKLSYPKLSFISCFSAVLFQTHILYPIFNLTVLSWTSDKEKLILWVHYIRLFSMLQSIILPTHLFWRIPFTHHELIFEKLWEEFFISLC